MWRYSELKSIEYNYLEEGTSYASLSIEIFINNGRDNSIEVSVSGCCAGSNNCLGLEPVIKETFNLANELIRNANAK